MGKVFKSIGKAVSGLFGGGSKPQVVYMPAPSPTEPVQDYAAEQKKAEEEALKKKQQHLNQGLNGTILGGDVGETDDVKKKKLLGE